MIKKTVIHSSIHIHPQTGVYYMPTHTDHTNTFDTTTRSTANNIIDRLDTTIVKLYSQTQDIDIQVEQLYAKQHEIDIEIEDAFKLRNDLATTLDINDGAYSDIDSLTDGWKLKNDGTSH